MNAFLSYRSCVMILITLRQLNCVTDCKQTDVGGAYRGKISHPDCVRWATSRQMNIEFGDGYSAGFDMPTLFRGSGFNRYNSINYCRNPKDPRNYGRKDPRGPYCLKFKRQGNVSPYYEVKYCAAFLHLCGKHISHSSLLFYTFTNKCIC